MKYPDTLKIHFINPKKKVSPATASRLNKFLRDFGDVLITHSYRHGSGIEYKVEDLKLWGSGRVVLKLNRKDDDGNVPDNLK